MTTIMIAFFGVVIAVNFTMARLASSTFGGAVVENSYVASQQFNGWLREAREQERLGWSAQAAGADGRQIAVTLRGPAGAIDDALVAVEAEHPLGRLPGQALVLRHVGSGRYVAVHALAPGRWRLAIEVRADGRTAHFTQEVRL